MEPARRVAVYVTYFVVVRLNNRPGIPNIDIDIVGELDRRPALFGPALQETLM
jgi:hypothetical protein